MKKISLILMFCIAFSCNEFQENENTYKIISLITQKFGRAMPPPPPPGKTYTLTKSQKDSISKLKQKIAIYPIRKRTKGLSEREVLKTKPYYSLIKSLDRLDNDEIDISLINNKINHELILLDTIKYKANRHYISKKFDRMLHFSPIAFDKEFTKAVTVFGNILGYLNGSSILLYLEKENDQWVIKDSEFLEIS
ncbi:hypothetical protein [uncultured Aquimarina sp.]|uniref:hypothetical protein n=1 Tax=uncultured Aquimarina sp. TaxID=575652 RepID=UPI00262FCCEA|nr:hypothetical protein [uncultured Aquimarina sp.]